MHGESRWQRVVVLAGCLLLATVPALAVQVVLAPRADTTLYQTSGSDVSSGAGPALYSGTTGGGLARRALLAFDASSLPAGVHVDSVQLLLHVTRTQDGQARSYALHRVRAPWGEGTSNAGGDSIGPGGGQGAPATAGDATWAFRVYDTQHWAQPGGEFDSEALAASRVGGVGACTWHSTPALVADVQRWVDGGENDGWIVVGEESASGSARRFAARESAIVESRPQLFVHFTPTAITPATWAAVKGIFR
jgi:hypothetical protein